MSLQTWSCTPQMEWGPHLSHQQPTTGYRMLTSQDVEDLQLGEGRWHTSLVWLSIFLTYPQGIFAYLHSKPQQHFCQHYSNSSHFVQSTATVSLRQPRFNPRRVDEKSSHCLKDHRQQEARQVEHRGAGLVPGGFDLLARLPRSSQEPDGSWGEKWPHTGDWLLHKPCKFTSTQAPNKPPPQKQLKHPDDVMNLALPNERYWSPQ